MRKLSPHPVPPAYAVPPHCASPGGAAVGWVLDAPGGLVQVLEPVRGTVELASWLVHTAYALLDGNFPNDNDLVLVLDFHMMVGRTAAARSIFLNSVKVLGGRFSQVYVVPPAAYPSIYVHAFQASLAFARLLGLRVTVASSSAQLIDRYGWQPLGTAPGLAEVAAG